MSRFQITAEDVKTIAAFGGLLLGLINLFLTLYKDYLRKGRPEISIERAAIKYIGGGSYVFQINLTISAVGGDVFLKDMYVRHEVIRELGLGGNNADRIQVLKLANYVHDDLLELDYGELYFKGKEMLEKAVDVKGLRINDKSLTPVTFIENWDTPSRDDGWHTFPLTGWSLLIFYGKSSVEAPFTFKEHPGSEAGGFR